MFQSQCLRSVFDSHLLRTCRASLTHPSLGSATCNLRLRIVAIAFNEARSPDSCGGRTAPICARRDEQSCASLHCCRSFGSNSTQRRVRCSREEEHLLAEMSSGPPVGAGVALAKPKRKQVSCRNAVDVEEDDGGGSLLSHRDRIVAVGLRSGRTTNASR